MIFEGFKGIKLFYIKGLYPGIGISVFGLIPAMSLYFASYEYSK